MLTVSSLEDPKALSLLQNIKCIASDLDHTLVDFDKAHDGAIEEITKKFGNDLANEINNTYQTLLAAHQNRIPRDKVYDNLIQEILNLQENTMHGKKTWTREGWIILAGAKIGTTLTKNTVESIRDLYWQSISKYTILYPKAKKFIQEIQNRSIKLVIMTGSDGIMHVSEDLKLKYDPQFSHKYKSVRMHTLPFLISGFVLGDPIDKPHEEFFDTVENSIHKLGGFQKNEILFLGDSIKADLEVPEKRGYKTMLVKTNNN